MTQIKEYSFVESALNELAIQYKDVPDAGTDKGYKACKVGAKSVGKYRIELESKRKEIKGPALERCKAIDEEAKRIQAVISEIETPLKLAYKVVDDENKRLEEVRISDINDRIEGMTVFADMARGGDSVDISEWIEQVDEIDCSKGFGELTKDAVEVKNRTLYALEIELRRAIQQEADDKKRAEEQKELEELRVLKTERDAEIERLKEDEQKKENEIRLVEQQKQAELERLESEKRAELAAKEAEGRRVRDVEAATQKAKQDEVDRQIAEKTAEKDRIEKLEANKKHVGKVRGEIKECLMKSCSIDEDLAKKVVLALLKIERITISY